MRITIDTGTNLLQVTENGATAEYPLFSPEAFHIVSRQWLVLGWNLGHWTTLSWMGRQILQLPDDILRLAELVWRAAARRDHRNRRLREAAVRCCSPASADRTEQAG